MPRIQRTPDWYRQFLRVYGEAPEPQEVGLILSPTVDLSDFYLADVGMEQAETVASPGAVGEGFAPVEVPAGELWLVQAVSSRLTVAGGPLGFRYCPSVCGFPFAVSPIWTPLTDMLTITLSAPNDFDMRGVKFDRPVPFNSGWRFGTSIGFHTGGVSIRTNVLFYRLRSTA